MAVAIAAPGWPPFLPGPDAMPTDMVVSIEHVWADPTLSRTVRGRPAAVPFDVYAAFIDTPDVSAAAARFRKLARYQVRALGEDWYEADDHDGSRGVYRVLVRRPGRRVILSWGEHQSRLLGRVSGSALTVIDFTEQDGHVDQELAAYVRIDNSVAAALARLLVPLFGHVADRKLTEGFTVTAKVAEWAFARPDEFCEWLRREPLPDERRERVARVLPVCGGAAAVRPPRP